MPSRSAHQPSLTVAALVAGLLLACGFLMWGPGHADMMGMAPTSATSTMTATSGTEHVQGEETATGGMGSGCPSMAPLDCPLASAQFSAPPALAAPVPAPLSAELTGPMPGSWAAGVECAQPRAPDPVSLLCISRT
ncbi:hypothetical protein [Streptomyces virginiae]|uniref:hypothetical protein n=1 Tax=Streptomyces virginiae TaxID=1961 RepID=UPI0022519DA0|nr:hypothetical protein [Streptomyces virginiae]MCX5270081.1 hypothetical protein [Streptomyces virginiae]